MKTQTTGRIEMKTNCRFSHTVLFVISMIGLLSSPWIGWCAENELSLTDHRQNRTGGLLQPSAESADKASTLPEKQTFTAADLEEPAEALFTKANQAYEDEQLETARDYYQAIVAKGLINSAVFYNLANTWFRMGELGQAVLNYERALRLDPRNADILHNLAYVRTFLTDHDGDIPPSAGGTLTNLLLFHNRSTTSEVLWLLVVLNALLAITFLSRLLVPLLSQKVWFGYVRGMLIVLVLVQTVAGITQIWYQHNDRLAVVLEDRVKARPAPESEEVLFEVNSGTRLELLAKRDGYAHIKLPSGVPAFVPAETVAPVRWDIN